jgi:hypothetical protein
MPLRTTRQAKQLRPVEKNNSTRLRWMLVCLKGTFSGAYFMRTDLIVFRQDRKEITMQSTLISIAENLDVFIPILLTLITLVVVYLVLMVRAVIDMLRYDVHSVLLTFAFIALIPFPLILVLGIMILIIWHYHKKDILAGKRQSR